MNDEISSVEGVGRPAGEGLGDDRWDGMGPRVHGGDRGTWSLLRW